jgi:hypothetical protein
MFLLMNVQVISAISAPESLSLIYVTDGSEWIDLDINYSMLAGSTILHRVCRGRGSMIRVIVPLMGPQTLSHQPQSTESASERVSYWPLHRYVLQHLKSYSVKYYGQADDTAKSICSFINDSDQYAPPSGETVGSRIPDAASTFSAALKIATSCYAAYENLDTPSTFLSEIGVSSIEDLWGLDSNGMNALLHALVRVGLQAKGATASIVQVRLSLLVCSFILANSKLREQIIEDPGASQEIASGADDRTRYLNMYVGNTDYAWILVATAARGQNGNRSGNIGALLNEWGVLVASDLLALEHSHIIELCGHFLPAQASKFRDAMQLPNVEETRDYIISLRTHLNSLVEADLLFKPLFLEHYKKSVADSRSRAGDSMEDFLINVDVSRLVIENESRFRSESHGRHEEILQQVWEIIHNPLKATDTENLTAYLIDIGVSKPDDILFLTCHHIQALCSHLKLAQRKKVLDLVKRLS